MGMPQAPPWNPTLFNNTMYTVHCTLIAVCIAHMYYYTILYYTILYYTILYYTKKKKKKKKKKNESTAITVQCIMYIVPLMNRTGLHAGETAWPNAGLGSTIGRVRSTPVV